MSQTNVDILIEKTVEQVEVIVEPNLYVVSVTVSNGGGGVSNHSELNLDDGTNPHGTTKADVGLGNVDNTSDVDKPISTATQTALNLKANLTDIPTVPSFADQTETNAGLVTDKTIAPNTLSGWWTYVKGLAQTFAQKITFTLGALFSPQAQPTHERGRIYFDDANDCISFMDSISGTSVQVGYEVLMRARNNTGAAIPNGSVVYISGAIGQNSTVALAQANALPTSEIIGIATHDIANNTVGKICVFGLVNDLNTNSFTDGQMLYLSATVAGGLTSTIPASPNFVVVLGVVEHAHPTQGKILVKPQRALANNNSLGTAQNVPPTQNSVKIANDSKLDKVTTGSVRRVYAVDSSNNQEMISVSDLATKNTQIFHWWGGNWTTTNLNQYYYIGYNGGAIIQQDSTGGAATTISAAMNGRNKGLFIAPFDCKIKRVMFKEAGSGSYTGNFVLASGLPNYGGTWNNSYFNIVTHLNQAISATGFEQHKNEFLVTDNITVPKGYVICPMLVFSAQAQAGKTGTDISIEIEEVV